MISPSSLDAILAFRTLAIVLSSYAIRFENICLSRKRGLLFDGLELQLPARKTTALIGPSGSGKSTLLKLINGLLRPDQGSVSVYGKAIDYSRLVELREQMGYMVQGSGLFPHLSIKINVSLKAKLLGWSKEQIHKRLGELFAMVHLPLHYLQRYPHELSGGEQQRASLCRALMLKPEILLLDEPFGALDPISRRGVQQEFLHIKESLPLTAVLVTHDLQEALSLGDHIVLLDGGKIAQSSAKEEFISAPANEFVKKFQRMQVI